MDTGAANVYKDGSFFKKIENFQQGKAIKNNGSLIIGKGFTGQLSCLRIYNRILTNSQIAEIKEADKSAYAGFKQTYPIAFDLWEVSQPELNEKNKLYITEYTG